MVSSIVMFYTSLLVGVSMKRFKVTDFITSPGNQFRKISQNREGSK